MKVDTSYKSAISRTILPFREIICLRPASPRIHCMIAESDWPDTVSPMSADGPVDGPRSTPPQVYRAKNADHWIVEPPQHTAGEGTMVFTGTQAQYYALTYAYEKFGSARYFPY
jgi:hypothetical protein